MHLVKGIPPIPHPPIWVLNKIEKEKRCFPNSEFRCPQADAQRLTETFWSASRHQISCHEMSISAWYTQTQPPAHVLQFLRADSNIRNKNWLEPQTVAYLYSDRWLWHLSPTYKVCEIWGHHGAEDSYFGVPSWWWRLYVPSKRCYKPSSLHGSITHKTSI
jgi:hypothetical protein